jgi:hypothetical protein
MLTGAWDHLPFVRKGDTVVADDEAQSQLATRIPKALHRELRLHCVKAETTVMDFVVRAISEKLKRDAARQRRSTRRPIGNLLPPPRR